ncbi:MAG: putative manganese-dependent inorganic diphosphatase [Lachnospiraceae bacterium]|nr:putative manganese-dependent inorganic diphosphatase [Lachnospiraceae bacterium]
MNNVENQNVYVIGHINPDTDAICSAITYANLKNKIHGGGYKARRAGQLNSETRFVLEKFGVNAPVYLSDVRTQVKDINIDRVEGVTGNISLKKAWDMMGRNKVVTLPILDDEHFLLGLITVGDIAMTYMEIYDNEILTKAKTPIANVVETVNGELIVGENTEILSEGKVLIAAANPDLMESYICKNDIVILGNRYESQLCCIEMNAKCIIVCDGAEVSRTIRKLADSKGCLVIKSPYDTFTVARLINQSIPIEYFMKSDDFTVFKMDDYIDDIKTIMAKKTHRNFPVFDSDGKFFGMISRRSLLEASRKKLILVDHNEKQQAVDGIEEADILEIIDHHRIGSLETISPVYFRNMPLGCTATIVYKMYQENNVEIEEWVAGLLCSAILSDTMIFHSPTCTEEDREAAEALAKIAKIDIMKYAKDMFTAGSNLMNKTIDEIFYSDYKKFTAENITFCVGQITTLNGEEFEQLKDKLKKYLEKAHSDQRVDMIILMLTDIMNEVSELLYVGANADTVIRRAFAIPKGEKKIILPGVISRKKQLIPALMMALQRDR